MVQLIALFLLLLVLLAVLAMVLTHYYFYIPIRELISGMKRLQNGDFTIQLPKNPTHEFEYINRNFNHTAQSIQKLINENYAGKLINKEAQLKNLQNQINEHFLYNTLDSIHWLARLEDAPRACDMVFALSNFYRLSLSFGKDLIPVRDVIKMLENYLYIQKFRMRDALDFSISCDPSLSEERILKNLLQPLVENAIIHGIAGLPRPCIIEIHFTRQQEYMQIKITDNGKGFSQEKLQKVREQLDSKDPYSEHSFALKTIQSQLQIFYGKDIALCIDTVIDQGTVVRLDLPITNERGTPDAKDDNC
jgi:two-component system sensor histidine kinase YesM